MLISRRDGSTPARAVPAVGEVAARGVHHLVEAQRDSRPDACAVRCHRGRQLTYAELWAESGRVARALVRNGVGAADPVVIAMDRSVEMVVSMLAVARVGAWYVLLDPYAPAARNRLIADEIGARAVVEAADQPDWAMPELPGRVVLPLPADPDDPTPAPHAVTNGEDALYVAYTSGSTGHPKGVVAPHRAVVNFLAAHDLCRVTGTDRVASLSSPASDATTFEVWSTLAAGATIVVLPGIGELDLGDWLAVLRRERVSVMFLMTPLFNLIAQEDPAAFAALDTVIFGGEAPNLATVLRVCRSSPPRRLVLGYGPTECTVFATRFECTTESLAGRDRIPLGDPLANYEIYLLDAEGRDVGPGETGEICVGGPGVGNGYLGRPELSARQFVTLPGVPAVALPPAAVYRSGDLAVHLPDGSLRFVSRADRQIKIRGYRVELEEVEQGVLATGLVRAAVVERVERGRPAHLVCFYTAATEPAPGAFTVELSAAVARHLPGYMVPARWVDAGRMPMTSNGKVDRARLLATLDSADGRGGEHD
ncbi:amino acid adenylation domain-containing protein [Longispora urticae]